MSSLSSIEIDVALDQLNRSLDRPWCIQDGCLHKEFVFADFVAAFGFMTRVAIIAEKLNHHPDWSNVFKTVQINLITHDAGEITQLDFDLAGQIERITSAWQAYE